MAAGVVQLADVIVPSRFSSYAQVLSKEKTALIDSGVIAENPLLNDFLASGGLTINLPKFKDLDNEEESVGSSNPANRIAYAGTGSAPDTLKKIGTAQEIAVRCSKSAGWSDASLAGLLAGADPMAAIAARVANYWKRRRQTAFVATMMGIFADNDASPAGSDTHTQYDLSVTIIGGGYSAGVTDFSADAYIDALATMGDAADDIVAVAMHSVVYNRALKNNLIDVQSDSANPNAEKIAYFLGKRVILDDGVPNPAGAGSAATAAGIYHTWLLGAGAFQMGLWTPPNGTELDRQPDAANGSGQTVLWNRQHWCLHPVGYAYAGTAPEGGPTNAATSNNLAAAGSWSRRYPERKQIALARLITREA